MVRSLDVRIGVRRGVPHDQEDGSAHTSGADECRDSVRESRTMSHRGDPEPARRLRIPVRSRYRTSLVTGRVISDATFTLEMRDQFEIALAHHTEEVSDAGPDESVRDHRVAGGHRLSP